MTPAAQAPSLTHRGGSAPQLALLYRATAGARALPLVHRFVATAARPFHARREQASRHRRLCGGGDARRLSRPGDPLSPAAGAISAPAASTAGMGSRKRSPPTASSGRASRSTSPPSACCSTPAPATPGATASRARGTCSNAPGLAVASLDMFRAGGFSGVADQPCRVDTIGLEQIDAARWRAISRSRPRQSADRSGSGATPCCAVWDRRSRAAGPVRPRACASRQPYRLLPARRRRRTHLGAAVCSPPCSKACRRSGRRA